MPSPSILAEKLRKRVIQNFMDILILTEMKKGSLSGYDVIGLIHRRFGILLSSGTVYSLLYSLERDGLIKGVWNQRKRVYMLSEKGEQDIKVIARASEEIQNLLKTSHCSMQPDNLNKKQRHFRPPYRLTYLIQVLLCMASFYRR